MLDPFRLTNHSRTRTELEEFWVFCLAVSGGRAAMIASRVDDFLSGCGEIGTPFERIRCMLAKGRLAHELRRARLGKYSLLARALEASVSRDAPDIAKASLSELRTIPGVGPRTARFFLLHSRKGQRVAALDAHMMRYLASRGHRVPKGTPNRRQYARLERLVLKRARALRMSPAEFDLAVWNHYESGGRHPLPGEREAGRRLSHVDDSRHRSAGRHVDWALAEAEVLPLLGNRGRTMLTNWRKRRPQAVDSMTGFVHRRIFDIRPEDLAPLLNPPLDRWPFPVGARRRDWHIPAVDNLSGGEPLVLAMHRYVEENARVPSWPDVVDWMTTPAMLPVFVTPAWELFHSLPDVARPERRRWQMAIQWRIGNAYLSFLREMDFLSRMTHEMGIPLRTHVVVDTVLKIDFWHGDDAICLWLPNSFVGRKETPSLVRGAVHDVIFRDRPTQWTSVSRVSESDLRKLALYLTARRMAA